MATEARRIRWLIAIASDDAARLRGGRDYCVGAGLGAVASSGSIPSA